MAATPTITSEQIGMRLDEFMSRYDEEPFELIDGEVLVVNPQMPRSSRITLRLARYLSAVVDENNLGEVFIETPFVLKSSAKWVKGSRVPDIMFITAPRLKDLADSDANWDISPLPLVPDLAIEIMSPTDRLALTKRKIKRYLNDGVQLAWIIDPDRRAVFVYTTSETVLTEDDKLMGGDILPDFEIEIAKLFEG